MNKIGMHIHTLSSEAYNALSQLQSKLVMIMDPKAEWIQDMRAISPGTYIVGRRYEDTHGFWQGVDPGEYARICHDMVAPQLTDGWVSANEPFGHDDHHLFEAFDQWQAAFVVALRELGIEGVVNCFGTGNFTGGEDRIKITEAFPRTCEVARVYGPHDYDWPHMDKTVGWRALRWVKWLEDLRAAGYEGAQVAVTECGLTQATYGGPDIGWQTLDDNLMIAADLYLDSLRWYNKELVRIQECIGCATYDWAGSSYGWQTFEHLVPYLVERIEEISAEIENGGNEMELKIYDFDHGPGDAETVDWDWLVETFGDVQIRAIEEKDGLTLREGDWIYKLVYLDARTGDANIIINVRDKDGDPVQGETVMFGWPDAPAHDYPSKPSNWTTTGVTGDTNENGDIGPGLGTGAYYSPDDGERGPHFVWVYDLPSDYIDGLGMLAGTFHAHLNLGYQAMKVQEENGDGDDDDDGNGNGNGGEPGEILNRLERIIEDAEWVKERLAEVDDWAEALADAL